MKFAGVPAFMWFLAGGALTGLLVGNKGLWISVAAGLVAASLVWANGLGLLQKSPHGDALGMFLGWGLVVVPPMVASAFVGAMFGWAVRGALGEGRTLYRKWQRKRLERLYPDD